MEIKLSGEIIVYIIVKTGEGTLIDDPDVYPCYWYFSMESCLISSKKPYKNDKGAKSSFIRFLKKYKIKNSYRFIYDKR